MYSDVCTMHTVHDATEMTKTTQSCSQHIILTRPKLQLSYLQLSPPIEVSTGRPLHTFSQALQATRHGAVGLQLKQGVRLCLLSIRIRLRILLRDVFFLSELDCLLGSIAKVLLGQTKDLV